MARMESVLGIDIGGTNIRLAQVDRELKVLRSLQVKVEEAQEGLVSFLAGAVQEFIDGEKSPSAP